MIKIENKGKDIVSTNYFDSEAAKAGAFYLTWNSGAGRLLVPDSMLGHVEEMRHAKMVVITAGNYQGGNMLEIMFDDATHAPYVIMIVAGASDRQPSDADIGKLFDFTVWTRDGKQLDFKAGYRKVDVLPCLDSWKQPH